MKTPRSGRVGISESLDITEDSSKSRNDFDLRLKPRESLEGLQVVAEASALPKAVRGRTNQHAFAFYFDVERAEAIAADRASLAFDASFEGVVGRGIGPRGFDGDHPVVAIDHRVAYHGRPSFDHRGFATRRLRSKQSEKPASRRRIGNFHARIAREIG